ncbi:MAG TPA: cytochrome b5-like heme/steroid binding domain-containing protein [bacterium]|nr:cytochrome b5-like heme/steroid binding domain-containing protein [bacterium]HPT30050.1 cytochrome b5-like heme/steroid binding domain-containing protein [bacterium]
MKKISMIISFFVVLFLAGCSSPQTSTNTAATNTVDPLAQVKQHQTASDCWMIIDGLTYNLTSYIPNHPGGDTILAGCGTDATQMFNNVQKHNAQVKAMLPQYLVK